MFVSKTMGLWITLSKKIPVCTNKRWFQQATDSAFGRGSEKPLESCMCMKKSRSFETWLSYKHWILIMCWLLIIAIVGIRLSMIIIFRNFIIMNDHTIIIAIWINVTICCPFTHWIMTGFLLDYFLDSCYPVHPHLFAERLSCQKFRRFLLHVDPLWLWMHFIPKVLAHSFQSHHTWPLAVSKSQKRSNFGEKSKKTNHHIAAIPKHIISPG